jgi:hypothetical protein
MANDGVMGYWSNIEFGYASMREMRNMNLLVLVVLRSFSK